MPSLTLLAADPYLTPVRARPALAFGARAARAVHESRGSRLRLWPRRRRDQRPSVAPVAAPRRDPAADGGEGGTVAAGLSSLRRRHGSSPSPRQAFLGWRSAVAAGLVALILGGLGVLRVWPPFAVVMSGSMAPTINTGDMVVLMRLRGPARVGEVVEVPVPDDARARYGYPPVVIHRVYRITGDQIRTKGDARPAADPFTVPQAAVDAKVVAHIPAGGRILSFFHSGPGLVWLLFGAALLFGLPLVDRLRDARGREVEATTDLRDQLAAVAAGLAQLQAEQERSRQAADATLGQVDRLAHLVAEALGQARPAVGDAVEAPAASPGDAADPGDTEAQPDPSVRHTPAPDSGPAVQSEPAETAPALEVATTTPLTPQPAPEPVLPPAPEPDRTIATLRTCAVRPVAGDSVSGRAADQLSALLAGSARDGRAPVESRGDVASHAGSGRVAAPAHVAPIWAPSSVACERWDAPPAAGSVTAAGWAGPPAPPAPVRSARFQRPGRLVAASVVRASSTA